MKKKYDLIFSHEEAAFLGVFLSKIWRISHVYDMHSSLPQQLENFNFSRSKFMKFLFIWMEGFILKNSHSVIVICQDLYNQVKNAGFGKKSVLLENFLDFEASSLPEESGMKKCEKLKSSGKKVVLYTGNFQTYQGVELLLEAVSKVQGERVILLLVGGTRSSVKRMKGKAKQLDVLNRVYFTGQVDPSEIPCYIKCADVLVSPRLSGTNTPLKIYSYLKSGKPLVATDLWTHTQVLNEKMCILVKPKPKDMAEGIQFALFSDDARLRAAAAQEISAKNYTFSKYKQKIGEALDKALQ